MYNVRRLSIDKIEKVLKIIEEAKDFLENQGVNQWRGEYPSRKDIEKDIQNKNGYSILLNDKIIGYFCLSFEKEKAYDESRIKWESRIDYGIIHRVAISNNFRGIGVSKFMFSYIDNYCKNKNIFAIKVDTDKTNTRMKNILEKNNFKYRGEILVDNEYKDAYEKILYR